MSALNLQTYASKVVTYLDEVKSENENIQAGKTTPFENLPLIVENLQNALADTKSEFLSTYLTAAQSISFANGDITLDSLLGHDLVCFFNTIQKLITFANGLYGNLNSYPVKETIAFYSNADNYTLSTDQFDDDDSNKIIDDSTFEYYTVQQGDTSRIIALRTTGDSENYIDILKINQISESDLISGSLVGAKIKIPIDSGNIGKIEDNLVYESNMNDVEKFVYGSGIDSDTNNKLLVSAKGDLLGVSGIDNAMNSINARLAAKKGTANVFSPDFGVINIGDGNQPLLVRIERFLTDYTNQIQSDPRVESVHVDMNSLALVGEKLNAKMKIFFVESSKSREVEI